MQLVNLEGTSLFGAGSEWFWAMGQFVVVIITLFGIYRQLRNAGAANAIARIETLHRRYESREMAVAKLSIVVALREGRGLESMVLRVDRVSGFFDTLAALEASGHMSMKEIDERFGGGVQIWWRLLRPTIEEGRRVEADPELAAGLERLNVEMERLARKRNAPRAWITEGPQNALLDELIRRLTDELELLNEVDAREIPRIAEATPMTAEASA